LFTCSWKWCKCRQTSNKFSCPIKRSTCKRVKSFHLWQWLTLFWSMRNWPIISTLPCSTDSSESVDCGSLHCFLVCYFSFGQLIFFSADLNQLMILSCWDLHTFLIQYEPIDYISVGSFELWQFWKELLLCLIFFMDGDSIKKPLNSLGTGLVI